MSLPPMPHPPRALRVLLEHAVDYAGLFPPAALDMRAAVERFAAYRDRGDAWMLGRFVLPASQLAEFEAVASPLLPQPTGEPWRLSVLGGAGDEDAILAFEARRGDQAQVESVELRAATPGEVLRLAGLHAGREQYVEVPLGPELPALVEALASGNLRAKLRTGGVTADAFPPVESVARFMTTCVDADVPFKATAGLHHPIRAEYPLTYEPGSASGLMFGFLNVCLAAAFARAQLPWSELLALLEERDRRAFHFDDHGVRWRGEALTIAQIELARRHAITSFGSCSFEEPARDLAALGLL